MKRQQNETEYLVPSYEEEDKSASSEYHHRCLVSCIRSENAYKYLLADPNKGT